MRGRLHPSRRGRAVPCVVLAHGFGAVKEGGPVRMAERFAAEGYAGLAFDYRYFGESGGEPRQLLDINGSSRIGAPRSRTRER